MENMEESAQKLIVVAVVALFFPLVMTVPSFFLLYFEPIEYLFSPKLEREK